MDREVLYMKLERLNTNKIKVTLTNDDLHEWNLNIEKLTHNSPEAQELFYELMRRAETELAFRAEGEQLLVEAIPSKGDGFVMLISKAGRAEAEPQRNKLRRPKVRQKPTYWIFSFPTFDDTVDACKRISRRFVGASHLYKYNGRYYLSLDCVVAFLSEEIEWMLSDFGTKAQQPSLLEGCLRERGELLIEYEAVENLSKHF